jgi:leader peptidase (prepilin peptidase)/N-methyltransferase
MTAAITSLLTIAIAAAIFAGAAFAGVELSKVVWTYARRAPEQPTAPEPPLAPFLVVTGALGAVIALRGLDWQGLVLAALICVSLVACWHSAVTHGAMPDYFTLVPLAAIVLSAVAQENWAILLAVLVPFIPFAAMAYLSKGKGMGWDDAKLAALGGGILGMEDALLAFAVACIVAVFVAWLRKRTKEPIAFGPYMIGGIALSLIHGLSPY